MSAGRPKKEKRFKAGSTRRLELHVKEFLASAYIMTPAEVGELFEMLMAEASEEPIPSTSSELVREFFKRRRKYSRIRGGWSRASLSLDVRRAVFGRDGGRCRYCERQIEWAEYHCDHVKPVSRGGGDEMRNLAAACRSCNLSKSAKPLKVWQP